MVLSRLPSVGLLAATALALLAGPLAQPAAAVTAVAYESEVISRAKAARTERSLPTVKLSSCVDKFAEKQARAMARRQQMFHQPMGPILQKCRLGQVGENVAYGFSGGAATTTAWLASPGHRANLLNPKHRLIGVGAYQDSGGVWYVSQVFGAAV